MVDIVGKMINFSMIDQQPRFMGLHIFFFLFLNFADCRFASPGSERSCNPVIFFGIKCPNFG